jgi:hypothetical protein
LNSYPFRERIDDPDVIKAFQEKFATVKPKVDPVGILRSMAETNGWHPDDLDVLATLPVTPTTTSYGMPVGMNCGSS